MIKRTLWLQNTVRVQYCTSAELLRNNFTDSLRLYHNPQKFWGWLAHAYASITGPSSTAAWVPGCSRNANKLLTGNDRQ